MHHRGTRKSGRTGLVSISVNIQPCKFACHCTEWYSCPMFEYHVSMNRKQHHRFLVGQTCHSEWNGLLLGTCAILLKNWAVSTSFLMRGQRSQVVQEFMFPLSANSCGNCHYKNATERQGDSKSKFTYRYLWVIKRTHKMHRHLFSTNECSTHKPVF